MIRRQRIYTNNTLNFQDTAEKNVAKSLAILSMMETTVLRELDNSNTKDDFKKAMWAVSDLLHDIKLAGDTLTEEKPVFADTLEEYQARVKAAQEQELSN